MLTSLKNIKEYEAEDITNASSEYIYNLVKGGISMNIKSFIKKNRVKEQDWFKNFLEYADYSEEYTINNVYILYDNEYKYCLVCLFNDNDEVIEESILTSKMADKLFIYLTKKGVE